MHPVGAQECQILELHFSFKYTIETSMHPDDYPSQILPPSRQCSKKEKIKRTTNVLADFGNNSRIS